MKIEYGRFCHRCAGTKVEFDMIPNTVEQLSLTTIIVPQLVPKYHPKYHTCDHCHGTGKEPR